jgi:hypothetical protein
MPLDLVHRLLEGLAPAERGIVELT